MFFLIEIAYTSTHYPVLCFVDDLVFLQVNLTLKYFREGNTFSFFFTTNKVQKALLLRC